jgi:hypothetical protein
MSLSSFCNLFWKKSFVEIKKTSFLSTRLNFLFAGILILS